MVDLLAQNGDSLGSFHDAIENLSEALLRLDRQVTGAQAALEALTAEGNFDLGQNKRLPDSFLPKLQAILVKNGLDPRIGAKFLLVQLVIELTATRPNNDPMAEEKYTKTVADKIRKIVKAHGAEK